MHVDVIAKMLLSCSIACLPSAHGVKAQCNYLTTFFMYLMSIHILNQFLLTHHFSMPRTLILACIILHLRLIWLSKYFEDPADGHHDEHKDVTETLQQTQSDFTDDVVGGHAQRQ